MLVIALCLNRIDSPEKPKKQCENKKRGGSDRKTEGAFSFYVHAIHPSVRLAHLGAEVSLMRGKEKRADGRRARPRSSSFFNRWRKTGSWVKGCKSLNVLIRPSPKDFFHHWSKCKPAYEAIHWRNKLPPAGLLFVWSTGNFFFPPL